MEESGLGLASFFSLCSATRLCVRESLSPQISHIRCQKVWSTALKVRSLSVLLRYLVQTSCAQLAQRYQDAPQGSREYLLNLLEIAAASVYALAGSLSLYVSWHRNINIKPPEPQGRLSRLFDKTHEFCVNFYHTNYRWFEKYLSGLLNVVRYWTKAEILGGVVSIEHEEGITKSFLHPQMTSHAF